MKKITFIIVLVVLVIFSMYGGIMVLSYFSSLPHLEKTNYLEIYDSNNKLIYSEIKGRKSKYISYEEINPHLLNCFINVEDKRFNSHDGFDYLRIIKAILNNLDEGDLKHEGASSISQQLARTLFLNNSKSFERKVKEAFYTIKLENNYTKQEIIEIYLNNVFFGGNLYGIEAASNYYFNKSSKLLNLNESAFLAGLVHSPNTYLYDESNIKALDRKNLVLRILLDNNVISLIEYNNLIDEDVNIVRVSKNEETNMDYYRDSVIYQLKKLGYDNEKLLNEGIKVYTYFDKDIYEISEEVVNEYQEELKNLELSLMIMKTANPGVLSIYGGKNYTNSPYNRVLYSKRQIGSTVKPLLYYLALLNGFNPLTKLMSERTIFNINGYGRYAPSNYGNIYPNRKITMLEAIATSDNIYAVKTMLYLGSKLLNDTLSMFCEVKEPLPSLALGTSEMTLLELTNMYHTFASLGKKYTPSFISKIENFKGQTLYKSSNNGYRVLSHDHLLVLASSLLAPYDKNAYKNIKPTMLSFPTRYRYATKTGSTKSDNYVIGYNPNYVIAVWTGDDEGKEIENSSISKKIFQNIANKLSYTYDENWYKIGNSRVVEYRVNPISGELSSYGSNYFINVR